MGLMTKLEKTINLNITDADVSKQEVTREKINQIADSID